MALPMGWQQSHRRLAAAMRRIQNGFVRSYAMWVFAGLVVILGYLIFRWIFGEA